jgi:hypothetical protein
MSIAYLDAAKSNLHYYYFSEFAHLIPSEIDACVKKSLKDFTRERKLPFAKTMVFVLSLTASGKSKGLDTKCSDFMRNARRSGLWPDALSVHRSSITKARNKIDWSIFADTLDQAVEIASKAWPDSSSYSWYGMSVYAIDGSKYTLPATVEIRQRFDPTSGLASNYKGHYPQCLVSTLYDVFRRLPIGRTVMDVSSSERDEALKLIPFVPKNSVLMFDRGYPSYEMILFAKSNYNGNFIFRCPAKSTFPAVDQFIKSGENDGIIFITPSNTYKNKVVKGQRQKLRAIKLRIIKLISPDGTVSVLLTNLFETIPTGQIRALYFRRWEIENYYRDEKITLEIEKFHSRKINGILQELFAVMIMSVIARTLMTLAKESLLREPLEPQFKHAIMTLASEAAIFLPQSPLSAVDIFDELIDEMVRVKYYRPKEPRPGKPRLTKRAENKWSRSKRKKAA